ncbi:MAG: NADH-quinone oxidoreductase subunit I [Deltaproteobacteria bacterium]|jgi:NADH-quinone oxidoreductase subunit I|nr:NADH-quinone oxidoreductase subunit I [Deltaproteobacteria bacterium]
MGGHGHGNEAKSAGSDLPEGVVRVSRNMDASDRLFVPAIAAGLGQTVKHFFTNIFGKEKYTQTVQYPDVKIEYPHRFRGMHRLVPREDGNPRCVACFMCQTACPARCIHIVAGETDDQRIEKFPVIFEIDELRCVVCGLCVEACPCDAIRMDTGFHPKPVYSREDADFGKADLLGILGREEAKAAGQRAKDKPPATAAGTGRVERAHGDHGAGGSAGGYDHSH